MLHVQTYDGWTALPEVCCLGSADIAQALLKRRADVHAYCKYGNIYAHTEQGALHMRRMMMVGRRCMRPAAWAAQK